MAGYKTFRAHGTAILGYAQRHAGEAQETARSALGSAQRFIKSGGKPRRS